ncbi:hypothetical protein [Thermopolyspora flexuosa]|uniref:hypothetical protein n=1 Tax=Thermopolyspora flexuosa TaxID=103836 RepID=UPI001E556976|nr:hypothetical protein [Thermopolyspora flexuosa]
MTPLRSRGGPAMGRAARGVRRPVASALLAVAMLAAAGCAGGAAPQETRQAGPGTAGGGAPQGAAAPAGGARAAAEAVTRRPRIPKGVTPGYMVFDTKTGKVTAQYRAHARYRSASVVKVLIALDYLESRPRGSAIPKRDLALLQPMLRSSHDDAASALWRRGGQRAIIQRMARRLRLTDSGPPPADKPGYWGYTAISAADVVKIYRYLLERADPAHRAFILGNLRKATKCGADGFYQYFGIPDAAPRPWAVKQGWSGYGMTPPVPCARTRASSLTATPAAATTAAARRAAAGAPGVDFTRPVLHTTGLVGRNERFIMAVLTSQPRGATWQSSVARITALTKEVYRAGVRE